MHHQLNGLLLKIHNFCHYPVIVGVERLFRLAAKGPGSLADTWYGGHTGFFCWDREKFPGEETAVNDISIGHYVIRFIDRHRRLNQAIKIKKSKVMTL